MAPQHIGIDLPASIVLPAGVGVDLPASIVLPASFGGINVILSGHIGILRRTQRNGVHLPTSIVLPASIGGCLLKPERIQSHVGWFVTLGKLVKTNI
jgi:hypothetical protein